MSTGTASGLKGTGYKQVQMQTLSPEQQALFSQLMGGAQRGLGSSGSGGGLDYLSKLAGGDQSMFSQLEAPAMRQFGQLQGGLASRFSGMGGSGARHSSGFQNTMSQAGSDLAERLQAQRMGLQQGAIEQLLGLSKSLLSTPTHDYFLQQNKPSKWQQLLGIGLPLLGGIAGFGLGGPGGAMTGANLGSSMSNAFSGG